MATYGLHFIGSAGGGTPVALARLPTVYALHFLGTYLNDHAPEVSGWTPEPGSILARDDSVSLVVEDPNGLGLVIVSVLYPSLGIEHLVYDGSAFAPGYSSSAVVLEDGSAAFVLRRDGGWLDGATIRVSSADGRGNLAQSSAAFDVSGVLETLEVPPPPATFSRPTLDELVDWGRAEMRTLPGGEAPLFRRSVETILVRILAGQAHGLHGHLAWLSDQILPDRGGDDSVLRWSEALGVPMRDASFAEGTLRFTAVDGSTISEGTQISRDDGVTFEVLSVALEEGGAIEPTVRATIAGSDANTPAGSEVSLTSPISGVTTNGVVASGGISGGLDPDTIETLRARVLSRLASPPRGGGGRGLSAVGA